MARGGKREGAGRPPKEEKTVCYHRRVQPEWVQLLDNRLEQIKMDKQILERGYVTYALTNEKDEIYGLTDCSINWEANKVETSHRFYWSEVYREPGYLATIIRKGQLLVNPSPQELEEKFKQSKTNLN